VGGRFGLLHGVVLSIGYLLNPGEDGAGGVGVNDITPK